MSRAYYVPFASRLAERGLAVTLFDLPGFAGSKTPDPPGWRTFLEETRATLKEHLGDDGIVVGHSLGGLTSLLVAPHLTTRGYVLLEPAVIPYRWLARLAAWLYMRQTYRKGPPQFRNRAPWYWRLHDPEGFPDRWYALVLENHSKTDPAQVIALHQELPEQYPLPFDAMNVPTLLVRGASSGPVMAWGQWDLARRLQHAQTVTIPDAAHWLVNEQDEAIIEAIDQFVNGLETADLPG